MKKTKSPGITEISRGRYQIRVRGKDPRTGKLRSKTRIVTCDLRKAKWLREEWHEELVTGEQDVGPEKMTVGDYASEWLDGRRLRVRLSSAEWYATVLDLHILPVFGDLYLDTVRKRDIERWLASKIGKPRRATINGWLAVVKMLFRDAAADYGLPDPAARVRPLPDLGEEPKRQALTAEELRRLLTVAREASPDQYPLLLTLALTGMRWGEATALKWSDLDEKEGMIHIARGHRRGRLGLPKNGRARTCSLPPELLEALNGHRRRLMTEQHPGLHEGWVFATKSREDPDQAALRSPKSWSKCLPKWVKAAKIEKHITPHSLRRTFVDLLRQAQVDAVVARSLVGHASEEMRNHYSTVAAAEQRLATARVVSLVGFASPSGNSGGESGGESGSENTESGPKAALK